MKSPVWRAIALLTLVAVVMGMASDANAARRSALAGNYFINDADDMFAFPQLYRTYQNTAIFDFAPSDSWADGETQMHGNATLVWGGDNHAIRVAGGRYDTAGRTGIWTWGGFDRFTALGPTGGNTLLGNAPFLRNQQFFDFGWATELGDMPFGVGFTWSAGSNKVTQGDDTVGTDQSLSNFQFQFGITPSQLFQLALELGFGSFKDKVATPAEVNDWSSTNFGLTSRGDIDNFAGFAWRYVAGFTYGSFSPKADQAESVTEMGLKGSFGPVFGTPGQWEVAGYITLDYRKFEDKGTEGTEDTESNTWFTFPSYNLAGEYYVNSWLVFRAGVAAMYASVTDKDDAATGTATKEDKYTEYMYMWTVGAGIDKGAWGLDFALEEEPFHSGYILNGDVNDDVFGYITAWFRW